MFRLLRKRMIIIFLINAVLSFAGIKCAKYLISTQHQIHQTELESFMLVMDATEKTSSWLFARITELETAGKLFDNHDPTERRLDDFTRMILDSDETYLSLEFFDRNGNEMLRDGSSKNIKSTAHFQEALNGRTTLSDPYQDENDNHCLEIAAPIFDYQQQVVGAAIATLSLQKAFSAFSSLEGVPEDSQMWLLIQPTTVLIDSTQGSIARQLNHLLYTELKEALEQHVRSEGNYGQFDLSQDVRMYYAQVPNTNWYQGLALPIEEWDIPLITVWLDHAEGILLAELVLSSLFIFGMYHGRQQHSRNQNQIRKETDDVSPGSVGEIPPLTRIHDLLEPYDSYIHHHHYVMIVTDRDFLIRSFNKRAEDVLGYSSEEVLRKETPLLWLDNQQLVERASFYSKEYGRKVDADCHAFVFPSCKGFPVDTEWLWKTRNGDSVTVVANVSPMMSSNGAIKGYVILARETKINESTRDRLFNIAENARDIIATFDANCDMFYINQAGLKFLGINQLRDENKSLMYYFSDKTKKLIQDGLNIAEQKGHWVHESEFNSPLGKSIVISQVIVPHFPNDGGEVFFSTIIRDISELKRIQAELINAKQEADEANHAKGVFLAKMSHEIRTPLNGIIGLSQLLQMTSLNELQEEYLRKIMDSSSLLFQIITDILDYSKIEAEMFSLECKEFQLEEIIQQLSGPLSVLLGNKPVDLLVEIDDHVPNTITGDSLRLAQVLLNLLSNAIKFTDEGMIELTVRKIEDAYKEFKLEFVIRDTGIGIRPEIMNKLFQPFVQAEEATTWYQSGTGLGLVIAKDITDAMGGTIKCNSKPTIGTEFNIILPFEKSTKELRQPFFLPVRILVAEENERVRDSLIKAFSPLCNLIIGTDTWLGAIQCMETQTFDVLIVDGELAYEKSNPLLNWLPMIMEGKRDDMRTIVYTTLEGRGIIQQLPVQHRPDKVLVKPVTSLCLTQAVAAVCSLDYFEESSPENEDEAQKAPPVPGDRVHLLLVEDNKINQIVIQHLLEAHGYKVTIAETGRQALQILEKEVFDGILMDLHVPEMNGLETAKRIRKDSRFSQITIILLTADITQQLSLHKEFNDVLYKPVNPSQLIEALPIHLKVNPRKSNSSEWRDKTNLVFSPELGIDVREALDRLDGKTHIYKRMLQVFQKEYETFFERLTKCVSIHDYALAIHMLHALKGAAANLGAIELIDAVAVAEKTIADSADLTTVLEHLQDNLNKALAACTWLLEQL